MQVSSLLWLPNLGPVPLLLRGQVSQDVSGFRDQNEVGGAGDKDDLRQSGPALASRASWVDPPPSHHEVWVRMKCSNPVSLPAGSGLALPAQSPGAQGWSRVDRHSLAVLGPG